MEIGPSFAFAMSERKLFHIKIRVQI